LNGQNVATMKVEKPKQDTMEAGQYGLSYNEGIAQEAYEDFFVIVEEMPIFPGGDKAIMEFLKKNTNQQLAKSINVSGTVYVSFVVDTAGQVTLVKVVRGINSVLDQEALRVVSSLPKWTPGRQRNRKVPVQFTLPIGFE
jgi:periplasmic protein TonB